MKINKVVIFFVTFLGLATAQSGWAADDGQQADAWQYEFTPYFFAAGLDGKAGVRGVTADVDLPFDKVWDSLDSGLMGLFTAQKGPWSFGLEGFYTKLSGEKVKSVSGPFGRVTVDGAAELTSKLYFYQGSVGYRVVDGTTSVDLLGAVRFTKLKVGLDVVITTDPAIVFPGGATSAGGSEDWTDAIVGARVIHAVSDKVALMGYADIGAGGSDLTYQLMAGLNWEFKPGFTAKLGYRYLDWDYKDHGTVWDMSLSGPYLGLGFAF